jgi:alkanesulfonate monooxygenase SsuD/methylene tetrahydromethanopterin reductase-like flavin-dependent oxidoreductase (luciferase family)
MARLSRSEMSDVQQGEAASPGPAPLGRWPASKREMGIGFIMPISDLGAFGPTPRFRDMLEMTLVAEEIGYDAVWIPDHFIVREQGVPLRGVWEGWTTLAGLAARTSRIAIGVFVTCTGFRNPGIVVKMAENLDEISGGRFVLGLGAGWHEPEFEMFGFPFDRRIARFEDAVRIIQPLVREGRADFRGEFFEARDAVNAPRGPRGAEGGPPIMIGTVGPRMMRNTARYADAWNSNWVRSPAGVAELMAQLDEACHEVGRDPKTLVRTASTNIAMPGCLDRRPDPIRGDTARIAAEIAAFRPLGLRHHVAGLDPCTPQSLEQYGRVIELLDKE